MAGIGPISTQDIIKPISATNENEKSKILAIKEHLAKYYKYDEEELEEIDIVKTKGDNVVYFAVSKYENMRDIYVHKAEVRNNDIILRSFIPPQFYPL